MVTASLFVSSFLVTPPVFAQTTTPKPTVMMEKATTTTSDVMESEVIVETKAEYILPYPGILPDHPLYFLKRLRDQILERLIVDPVRKIEFYMLQADKSVNTGLFLAAKESEALASESLTRGQAYLDQAVRAAAALKAQGKEVPPYLVERFTNAGAKYEEVLMDLISRASQTQKAVLTSLVESFAKLQEEVAKLK